MSQEDRRKLTRLPLQLRAELELPNGMFINCDTQDLSFGGAFLDCSEGIGNLAVGGQCRLHIYLARKDSPLTSNFDAHVVHIEDDGKALRIKFVSSEQEVFEHFKKFIMSSSDDPQKLIDELEQHRPDLFD